MLIALMTMSPVDGARPPHAVSLTAHVKAGGTGERVIEFWALRKNV
jgi:hypothetical protein